MAKTEVKVTMYAEDGRIFYVSYADHKQTKILLNCSGYEFKLTKDDASTLAQLLNTYVQGFSFPLNPDVDQHSAFDNTELNGV